jgi:nucleoside-diphosphate-sugar epimerase
MKVLVTGGAGYVGSVLVPLLLENGHDVVVLDSLRKGGLGLLPVAGSPRFDLIRGDVRDERAVSQAVRGVDAIMHLAAIVGFPACNKDPWLARTTNVDGTLNLLAHRSRGQLMVFPSSLSNYGNVVGRACTEDMEPEPITLYGVTKLEAERRVREEENSIVFRPATAFGLSPQMRLDLLFNDFVYKAVKEKFLLVYEPHYHRAFVHVHDFARAFLYALDHADRMVGQVYNLGWEDLNLTKGELAQKIRERIDFVLQVSEVGKDPDQRNYEVDFSKLRAAGFRTEVGVEDGIDELVRGYRVIDVVNPFSNTAHV